MGFFFFFASYFSSCRRKWVTALSHVTEQITNHLWVWNSDPIKCRENKILRMLSSHNAFMSGGDRGAHTSAPLPQLGGFHPNPVLVSWLSFTATLSHFMFLISSSCFFIKCLGLVSVNFWWTESIFCSGRSHDLVFLNERVQGSVLCSVH